MIKSAVYPVKSADCLRLDLALVLVRFPEKASQIRQLASDNEEFREICEHYSLARAALDRFQCQSTDGQRPEVAEYKLLIADLEREIQELIERGPPNNDDRPLSNEPTDA